MLIYVEPVFVSRGRGRNFERYIEWEVHSDLQGVKWARISAPLRVPRYGTVPQLWFPARMAEGTTWESFQPLAVLIISLSELNLCHIVEHNQNVYQLSYALYDIFRPRQPTEGGYCAVRGGLFNLDCGNLGWVRNTQWFDLPDTPPKTFDHENLEANCASL